MPHFSHLYVPVHYKSADGKWLFCFHLMAIYSCLDWYIPSIEFLCFSNCTSAEYFFSQYHLEGNTEFCWVSISVYLNCGTHNLLHIYTDYTNLKFLQPLQNNWPPSAKFLFRFTVAVFFCTWKFWRKFHNYNTSCIESRFRR